jgi:carboxyl-terminal processing protease
MSMKGQRIALLVLVGFVAFLSGGWLLQRGVVVGGNVYQQARLFDDVLGYVADYYVDSLGEAQLYDKAIDGLLNELDDPYARFLRPADFQELTETTTGKYGGLGIQIDVRDGWITIVAPIAETPAEAAGLETGDRIVAVDGRSTYGWKDDQAVSELRGEPGSSVTITVARPGFPEPFDVTVKRAEIHVKAIRQASIIGDGIGYVSLVNSSVSESLARELVDEIGRLRQQGARSLILDLRYNPGGLLDQGVDVSDLFLTEGQAIVTTRGRAPGATEAYRARTPERWPEMPVVVLVNGGTASAAEIIAGALQDHDRAVVIGTPTFGKGLVQTVFRLGRAQGLRLTTARWYTPSGRTIQRDRRDPGAVVAMMEDEADPDSAISPPDSTEAFHTDGGRTVLGGGGIHPDLVVRPDTLSTAEQEFLRGLGSRYGDYRGVLTTYALELKAQNAITDRDFAVTDAMRGEILRRMRAHGIETTAEGFNAARRYVAQDFGFEVERYVFGPEAGSLRRIAEDVQVQKAIELLTEVRSTQELFAAAGREQTKRNY